MRQILPIAGAIIGSFIPGVGTQLGFMIGSLIGNAVDPQVIKGPSIGDGQTQTSKEGVPIPRIYGTACVSGNIIALSPNRKSIKKTQQGKGGPVTEEERLHRDFAIGIVGHKVDGLLRIWEDEKLVYDVRVEDSQVKTEENKKYAKGFVFYLGDEEQLPDPTLEAIFGAGNTPAYRGLSYIVFKNMDLTDRRGSIPNYRFEISQGGEFVIYPEDRVACNQGSGNSISGGQSSFLGVKKESRNTSITLKPDFTSKIYQLDFQINFNNNFFVHGVSSGVFPGRFLIRSEAGGGGNVLYSSGWICHTSQVSDIVNFIAYTGENDVINSFDENDERYNITKGVFKQLVELRIPLGPIAYVTYEYAIFAPIFPSSFVGIFHSQYFISPDTDLFNEEEYIAHPEYPAALYNINTFETLWTCWAADEYIIGGKGAPVALNTIINDIVQKCDIPLSKIDTSELEGKDVRGLVVAQQYPSKNIITSLQQSYFFDPSEYDEKINFINRGKDAEFTMTIDDLVDDPFEQNRKSTIEYPKKLNLLFQNSTIGYDSAKATAERNSPNVQVSGEKSIEVPVVLIEDEAAQIADKQLKIAWAEAQGDYTFSVPTNLYDHLVPADVFGMYLRGQSQRMRIDKIERADGVLQLTAKIDRQSAYHSNAKGIPLPAPTPPPETITGAPEFAYLNIPALVDSNDFLGYYVSMTGKTNAYYGGIVERKTDGVEEDFYTIKQMNAGKTIGYLLDTVSDASEHYSDTTNTIHLKLYNKTDYQVFETVSQEVLLRENNAIAITRDDGTAEIMQFRDVENLGDGEYKLTYLLRGRLNSGTSEHATSAKVVWLEDVELVTADAQEIGETFIHRPTSYGESPEDSLEYTNDFEQPLMQTEFPVDLLRAEVVGGNVEVKWSPRERFGSEINPVRSINWERYEIVYSDGTTTIEATSQTPTHTQSLSSFSGTLSITVYQVNRYTGRGPGVSLNVAL